MNYASTLSLCAVGALLHCGAAMADAEGTSIAQLPYGYAAAAFQSPVAFGGSWGSVGLAALGYKADEHRDASMAAAIGLGDPDAVVGLDVATVFSSLTESEGSDRGFGKDGSFALKLHRNLGDYTAIAIGGSALGRWGSDIYMDNNPPGYYAAVTRAVFLGDHAVMLTLGAGKDVANKRETQGIDPLGSVAFYFTYWSSAIVEYNGFGANAAISVAPLPRWLPLTITVGALDFTEQHNESLRFAVTAGLGFKF